MVVKREDDTAKSESRPNSLKKKGRFSTQKSKNESNNHHCVPYFAITKQEDKINEDSGSESGSENVKDEEEE